MNSYKTCANAFPIACFLFFGAPGLLAQSQPSASKTLSVQDPAQDLIDRDKVLKRKIRLWEWTLTQIAKRENASIFMDVPLDRDPPDIAYNRPLGINTMKAL